MRSTGVAVPAHTQVKRSAMLCATTFEKARVLAPLAEIVPSVVHVAPSSVE